MKSQNALMYLMLICVGLFSAEVLSSDPITPNLKFIASVDGKSFFAENNSSRTWIEAGEYCKSMGMELAAITSVYQARALSAAFASDFSGNHWTSGRDAQLLRQFSWDTTADEIALDLDLQLDSSTLPYQTCLAFESRSANASAFRIYACTANLYVLCETT